MAEKRNRNDFLKMFEDVQKEAEENSLETEDMSFIQKISAFFYCFRYQSFQYQLVWTIRIICWILIFAVIIFGTVIKIKNKF